MTRPEVTYAVETLNRKFRWEVHHFKSLAAAKRFCIAESRRTRIGLQVCRLTPIDGGIATEYLAGSGRWINVAGEPVPSEV